MAYRYRCTNCNDEIIVRFCKPGDKAICKNCQQPVVVPENAEIVDPSAMPTAQVCRNHPAIPSIHTCSRCHVSLCDTCAFAASDGTHLCPACAISVAKACNTVGAVGLRPQVPEGKMCMVHPEVVAVAVCDSCGQFICATCDFVFPGNMHACPACVAKPPEGMDDKRKNQVIWSYVLGAVAMVSLVLLLTGAAAGLFENTEDQALGIIISLLVFAPGTVGLALAIGAYDKRLHNPSTITGAIVCNAILVGLYLLLSIVGSLS